MSISHSNTIWFYSSLQDPFSIFQTRHDMGLHGMTLDRQGSLHGITFPALFLLIVFCCAVYITAVAQAAAPCIPRMHISTGQERTCPTASQTALFARFWTFGLCGGDMRFPGISPRQTSPSSSKTVPSPLRPGDGIRALVGRDPGPVGCAFVAPFLLSPFCICPRYYEQALSLSHFAWFTPDVVWRAARVWVGA